MDKHSITFNFKEFQMNRNKIRFELSVATFRFICKFKECSFNALMLGVSIKSAAFDHADMADVLTDLIRQGRVKITEHMGFRKDTAY